MKKLIIVGATSGMGRELARIYAQQGCRVGATGRRSELLDSLQAEFPSLVSCSCFDVRGEDSILRLKELVAVLGGIDLLVICAGIGIVNPKMIWDIDKTTIDTNVLAFTRMITWAYHLFANQGGGQIANISSVACWRGNSWAPAYSASKAFQSIYFEGLHMKTKKLKLPVRITDIQPGFVDTKTSQGNKRFWVATVEKASLQIYHAIESGKFRVYITHRWQWVAWVMKWMPGFIYHRFG